MDLDAEIDRLYGLPLDEFVDERGKLAKQVRGEGDREAADDVKGLRKPTMGAWAINQVVRRRPSERDKLLKAGDRLRKAHEQVLSGGDQGALRDAMAAERKLVGSLADAAEAIATETGKAGAALKDRVRGTLHAAALDEEVRDELAAGRLLRERDAVGLGPFGALTTEPTGSSRTKRSGGAPSAKKSAPGKGTRSAGKAGSRKDAAARKREEREEAKARKREEREQAKRDRAQLKRAERSLASAHAALAKAAAAHEEAEGDLDAARRALRAAEKVEKEARATKRTRAKDVADREREVERLT